MLTRREFLKTAAIGGTSLAAMGLVGCGSSSSSTASSSESSSSSSSEAEETTVQTIAEAAAAEQGEMDTEADYSSMVIATSGMDKSLSPNIIASDYNIMIYGYVATIDNTTGNLVGLMGDLTLDDDRQTVHIDMYDNIYDSEGNHITASDVIFSWNNSKELGMSSVNKWDSWEMTDEYTLVFHMKDPMPINGTGMQVFVYSQAAYEANPEGFATNPISCGPYKVRSFTADYELVLERNENFWPTDEQKEKVESIMGSIWTANWDTITWKVISESTQVTVALEMGDVDFTSSMSTDDLELLDEGGELADDYYVFDYVSGLCYCLVFNTDEASPLSDVRLRRAVGYAINTEYLINVIWTGEALQAYEVGASTLQDYNPDWITEDNYYQYDVDKAKELLAEAGYEDGLELTIMTTSGSTFENIAVVLQSQLMQVGIDLEIQALDQSVSNQYKESDRSSWDITTNQVGSETFMYYAYSRAYSTTQYSWEGTAGYWNDEEFNQMLTDLLTVEGYSAEALEEVHEYTIENALMYGMANPYSKYVLRTGLKPSFSPEGSKTYYGAFYWAVE